MIEAGYSERDFVVETIDSGAVGITELSGCEETLCGHLSMDCLGLRSPSVVRARGTSGIAFDPVSAAVLPASDLYPFRRLANPKQLHCGIFKCFRTPLISVAVVRGGTAIRMSQMPVKSFPMSIKIVNTMPRQRTVPVNMRVTGIENPIEA